MNYAHRLDAKYVFDPLMLEEGAVRGIMTSIVGISRALAHLGHDVRVFTRKCPRPGLYDGVEYLPTQKLAGSCREKVIDILICLPPVLPLLFPIPARARVVWTHDASEKGDYALAFMWTPQQGMPAQFVKLLPLSRLDWLADRIFVISDFQMRSYAKGTGLPCEKFFLTRNGVFWEHFALSPQPERHRDRLVYLSEARRGLDVLLDIFPKIRERVPHCELHIFSPEIGFNKKQQRQVSLEDLQAQFVNAGYPGVVWRGGLSKRQLAQELRVASLMAYPCHFLENFPTAVAEAQAAGLPVVTSAWAGLLERVDHGTDGFLIPVATEADVHKSTYQQEFIERVVELLRDDVLWERMSQAAREKARRLYDWDQIAKEWEMELSHLIQDQAPRLPSAPERLHLLQHLLDPQWRETELKGRRVQLPLPIVRGELERQCRAHGFTLEETGWVS